jgi:hypothetical protein
VDALPPVDSSFEVAQMMLVPVASGTSSHMPHRLCLAYAIPMPHLSLQAGGCWQQFSTGGLFASAASFLYMPRMAGFFQHHIHVQCRQQLGPIRELLHCWIGSTRPLPYVPGAALCGGPAGSHVGGCIASSCCSQLISGVDAAAACELGMMLGYRLQALQSCMQVIWVSCTGSDARRRCTRLHPPG